jgi:hypothetical protein
MTPRLLLTILLLSCTACTPPLQGPEADLHAIATPDPVPQAVCTVPPPAPQPAPGPTPGVGRWRAWVPRQVQPNGDVTEGHWLDLGLDPPIVEVLEPVTPMPRAPKTHLGAKPTAAPSTASAPGAHASTPTPVLPSGLTPPEAQRMLRVPHVPLAVPGLGGQ